MEFEEFMDLWSNCCRCEELCKNRKNIVFGEGNKDPDIVIIGEAPGAKEDELGRPFVGKSGAELDKLLNHIGLLREDVFIMNVVMCRPPGNRNPKSSEIKNCSRRFYDQLKILNPKIVLTLGNFSTKAVLNSKKGITSLRGHFFEKDGYLVFPSLHPATILYSGGRKRKILEDDFLLLKEYIDGKDFPILKL